MSWRLARSLETQRAEVLERYPGTTIWTIGDVDHRARASDHNPNAADIVCAIDILGRAPARAVWDLILITRDSRLKYMIFDGQIVNSTIRPWEIRPYSGDNPHRDHIHVSVGRGRDGASTRPDLYDDPSPWWGTSEEDDLTPDERKMLRSIYKSIGGDPDNLGGDSDRPRNLADDHRRLRFDSRAKGRALGLEVDVDGEPGKDIVS